MNRSGAVLTAVALLILIAGTASAAGASTPGTATYSIQTTGQGQTQSATVNETVATTSNPSYDNFIIKFATGTSTYNYSRLVNSSDNLSPFLPSITNQTFSSSSGTASLTANIMQNGTEDVQFQGASHTLTSYSLVGSVSSNSSSVNINGALATFPSGLVYSAELNVSFALSPSVINATSSGASSIPAQGSELVRFTLLSTSFPLNIASSSPAAQVVSIGIGAGAAVSALAVGLGVRRHNKRDGTVPETKPDHWVD